MNCLVVSVSHEVALVGNLLDNHAFWQDRWSRVVLKFSEPASTSVLDVRTGLFEVCDPALVADGGVIRQADVEETGVLLGHERVKVVDRGSNVEESILMYSHGLRLLGLDPVLCS